MWRVPARNVLAAAVAVADAEVDTVAAVVVVVVVADINVGVAFRRGPDDVTGLVLFKVFF